MEAIKFGKFNKEVDPNVQCIVCESTELVALEAIDVVQQHKLYAPTTLLRQKQLTEAAQKSSLEYQIKRCNSCLLEYATPLIAPNSDWYDLAYQTLSLYPQKRWEYDFVINKMQKEQLLYELGCGSGEFLKLCKEMSIPAFGFDFSPEAVLACKGKGLDANLFDLTKPAYQTSEKAKYITAFHVLEHLDCPAALFQFARSKADAKSVFWVAIPSNARPTRVFEETDFLDQPPHHMTRWTPESLKRLGSKEGWILEKVYYEPISYTTSLWWVTTRTKIYKRLVTKTHQSRLFERFIRILLTPYSAMLKSLFYKDLKGFTMLAQYRLAD